jgi:hypothetical protein
MKKLIFIQIAVVAIIAVIGQVWRADAYANDPFLFRTQEDTLNKGFGVEYVMGRDYSGSLINYPDQLDGLADDAAVIAIGQPTGEIFQEGMVFGQKILVQRIIKGAEKLRAAGYEESFYAFCPDGFHDYYEDGKARYAGGYGLMQKSSQYLLFLEETKFDLLLPVKGYMILGGFLGRLKLDEDGVRSTPVDIPVDELKYEDIWDYEYIADSQEVLDEVYRMKEHVLSLVPEVG